MKKEFVVYKCTNKINGKIYIGKTYNFEKRKREHIYDIGNGLPFHRALYKYGLENFTWEIIDSAKTDEEIKEKEIYWIKIYNSCIHSKNSNGYNITVGGEGGTSWNSKQVVMFNLNGEYVDEFMSCACASALMELDRKSIERACKTEYSRCGKFQWMYKEDWNGENIGKYIRKESTKNRKIVQLDLKGNFIKEFDSITIASKETGTRRTSISSCLSGSIKTANNYLWIYKSEYDPCKNYEYKGFEIGEGIVQLSKEGTFIARFNNCLIAAKEVYDNPLKDYKLINKALSTKSHIAKGYKWMKYEDYKLQYGNTEVIK